MAPLFKRRKKSSNTLSQRGQPPNSFQRRIDRSQRFQRERQPVPTWAESAGRIRSQVDENLRAFETCVKEITETSLKLEELAKIYESGEISESAYRLIVSELGGQLSTSVERIFMLREILELAKARAKLECAREKIGLKEFESEEVHSMLQYDGYVKGHIDLIAPLSGWEDLISKIDEALSSLAMEQEASIVERYLSFAKEKLSAEARSEETKGVKTVFQKRLDSISDRWASTRREKIEKTVNLELKASQIRDDIKEVEARFAVGEVDQRTFEYKMSALQASLKRVTKEISEVRGHIDDMDMRIFRCSELVRESS